MVLVDEINEENYIEEREKGKKELQKKFDDYDLLRNIGNNSELKKLLAVKFQDPTIWAYATLFDKQGNRLKLFPYQDKFVNDRNRFIYIAASNQVGKTFAICVKGLHHALLVPNASVVIVSKSESQAIMILDEIKWMMKRARLDYSEQVGEIENRTELHIIGPKGSISVIRCFPPNNYSSWISCYSHDW